VHANDFRVHPALEKVRWKQTRQLRAVSDRVDRSPGGRKIDMGKVGGKCEFAAIANLKCAYFVSGPPTGSRHTFPFCAAAVRSEPNVTDVAKCSNVRFRGAQEA